MKQDINKLVMATVEETITHRRHLHQFPELSGKEFQTQKYIKNVLDDYNINWTEAATTGVVAIIDSGTKGSCVGLRGDIDALPIQEVNDVIYKSKHPNVMHACGHDAHTAILLGVAKVLHGIKNNFTGKVKLIFQPDEEQNGAARRIVNEGLLEDVDVMLGCHVMPYLEVGEIEYKDGVLNAQTTSVVIDIHGVGAHGAYPHKGVDAIAIAGNLIVQLQTIVSRVISPLDQAVLTFGVIEGGTRQNIIANHVRLRGTLRTVNNETRDIIKQRIIDISNLSAASMGGTASVSLHDGYPTVVNDAWVNVHIKDNANEMAQVTKVYKKEHPSMGAEDFGYYLDVAPGAFFHLGCGNKQKGITSGLHTDSFDIDERCLAIGVELQVRNVLSLLKHTK